MSLEVLPQAFTICKLPPGTPVDLAVPFCFAGRTDTELSLVCPTEATPAAAFTREDGWRAMRVAGTMPFTLTGVLSRLTGLLAEAGVPLFAVSTFDTDYVLVKQERLGQAIAALQSGGISVPADVNGRF